MDTEKIPKGSPERKLVGPNVNNPRRMQIASVCQRMISRPPTPVPRLTL